MLIKNADTSYRSAFVYNSNDWSMMTALASKPLSPGEEWWYSPPSNLRNRYVVLFKRAATGGSIMAGSTGADGNQFIFDGYNVQMK